MSARRAAGHRRGWWHRDRVQVTNSVQRLYAGLQLSKTLTDPAGAVKSGTKFAGVWTCAQGSDTLSERFSVTAGTSTVLFTPEDARVPATSVCSVLEDTLNPDVLVDGSFAWGPVAYDLEAVTLVTGETASLGITTPSSGSTPTSRSPRRSSARVRTRSPMNVSTPAP